MPYTPEYCPNPKMSRFLSCTTCYRVRKGSSQNIILLPTVHVARSILNAIYTRILYWFEPCSIIKVVLAAVQKNPGGRSFQSLLIRGSSFVNGLIFFRCSNLFYRNNEANNSTSVFSQRCHEFNCDPLSSRFKKYLIFLVVSQR